MIETLDRLGFLLAEMETWDHLPADALARLVQKYERRGRETEIALGLREPPLDAQAAQVVQGELSCLRALLQEIPQWVDQGWLALAEGNDLQAEAKARSQALWDRLIDAPRIETVASESLPRVFYRKRLDQLHFLQRTLVDLHTSGRLVDDAAFDLCSGELVDRIGQLEIDAGLRPAPAPPPPEAPPLPEAPPPPAAPLRPSRPPLTWDRIWEALLSENTLRALLFVGVGLLFAAALSLIIWNWEFFPPWLQVAFLTCFTAIFYTLGWYVRERMRLRITGIALSAVGSLIVPLDFYAFYLSGGFPRERWPEVWLVASLVSLVAYLLTVYFIQAEFFGYLVGAAAGSALAAVLKVAGLDLNWWQAVIMAWALASAVLAEGLERREGRWRVLVTPLWHVALTMAAVVQVLAFGLVFAGRVRNDVFYAALALDWWLGGALFCLAARRYRHRMMGLVAALSFPVAVWLTQEVIFDRWEIEAAWHALGWALLAPVYLAVGWMLLRQEDKVWRTYGRTALSFAVVLVGAAAAWSLTRAEVAGVVHPLLAVTVVLAVGLWQKPSLSPLASLFLLSGTGAWLSGRGAGVGQLGLVWALLAILHVVVVLGLRRIGQRVPSAPRYDGPVYLAGWGTALLALLPPLSILDRPALAYTLVNLAAISAWLALLLHVKEAPGLRRFLDARQLRLTLFHWTAAIPLLPWVWLVWLGRRPAEARLALPYMGLAGILLALGLWLRRLRWSYGRPWFTAAHLSGFMAILVAYRFYDQGWMALILLLAAGLYFASARLLHRRFWLGLGGLVLPFGWALGLDWLGLPRDPLPVALALLVPVYIGVAGLLERYRGIPRAFLSPFYNVSRFLAIAASGWLLALVISYGDSDSTRLWVAGGLLLVGIGASLYAWLSQNPDYGHIAAWYGVFAGALVAAVYSQGRGSSAAKAALLAWVYVLAERGLLWAGRSGRVPLRWRPWFRRAWRLYRRPLLVAGWSVSLGAILLALLRNLFILGGGRVRETWSVVGLVMVVGLYALAAWLFRRRRYAVRFVWLAGLLAIAPWTLLSHMGWYVWGKPTAPAYAVGWAALALLELLLGLYLMRRLAVGRPLQIIAHVLLPLSLLWGIADVHTSSWTFGLAVAFYLLAVWQDRLSVTEAPPRPRFLYPAAAAVPVWAVYLLAHLVPQAPQTTYGWLLLGFSLVLFLGRWVERRQRAYGLPLYLVAFASAIVGTLLVAHDRPALILALLLDTALATVSAWLFREPLWVYPGAATLSVALVLALAEWQVPASRRGWGLIALGGLYLLVAWLLRRRRLSPVEPEPGGFPRYAPPLMAAGFLLIALGLPPSSQDRIGALVGYGAAALLYALAAVWLQQPLLLTPAAGLAMVPYVLGMFELGISPQYYGLALWPGIAAALLLAHGLDWRWGVQSGEPLCPFLWDRPGEWVQAAAERLTRWWALPLYAVAYAGAAASPFFSLERPAYLTLTLLLAALVYALATYRFRLRGWLLLAVAAAQLAALAAIRWWGWEGPEPLALCFAPVTWLTALAGLFIAWLREEGPPIGPQRRSLWSGWSRPLYALVLLDLLVSQILAFHAESAWVSLWQALLLGLLATVWLAPNLAYALPALGLVSLLQYLLWGQADILVLPPALALLALAYGLVGCWLRLWRQRGTLPRPLALWERPMRRAGLLLSFFSLFLMVIGGFDVFQLAMRAALGRPLVTPADLPQVQMVVGVLAILGLLYLLMAVVDRRRWLGYAAVGLLLGAWSLEWLLVWEMREVQWYAIPAGLYLMGVGYLEWTYGSRNLARWIDQAAMLLWLGSAFWQALGDKGLPYALLMIGEGVLLILWGSIRRLRRFIYTGVPGAFLGMAAVAIDPRLRQYRVLIFAVPGILIIVLVLLLERNIERVREQLKRLE